MCVHTLFGTEALVCEHTDSQGCCCISVSQRQEMMMSDFSAPDLVCVCVWLLLTLCVCGCVRVCAQAKSMGAEFLTVEVRDDVDSAGLQFGMACFRRPGHKRQWGMPQLLAVG